MLAPIDEASRLPTGPVRATLLGRFSVAYAGKEAGPWARPPARRLLQLVLVSPGHRVSREAARAAIFPSRGREQGTRSLYQALSMARSALSAFGQIGGDLLQADRAHIWLNPAFQVEVDVEQQQERLHAALAASAGPLRDAQLVRAIPAEGLLLADEPGAEWACRPREQFEWLRQEARLALARDRLRGKGNAGPEAVLSAWEDCTEHDPTSEEAASALMRLYAAQGRAAMVESTYLRCSRALEDLGLRSSPGLFEVYRATSAVAPAIWPGGDGAPAARSPVTVPDPATAPERRLVSVLFAELASLARTSELTSAEDLREEVASALAEVMAQVEELGGIVTSVSGTGLVGLFGAPEAHEDDPERAVRAALRAVKRLGRPGNNMSLRCGVESGRAVVGPMVASSPAHFGAVGAVVSTAARLQSLARPASVLVGRATRAAAEELFEWGQPEELPGSSAQEPAIAYYVVGQSAPRSTSTGQRRKGRPTPLVGREEELEALKEVIRSVTAGVGGALVLAGEPGVGKTRMVQECRKLFTAWVGAGSGRLPLWLEGRAVSYASAEPYGLFRQLLAAWLGLAPDESEGVVRPALARATRAVFGAAGTGDEAALLGQVLGLPLGPTSPLPAGLGPEALQRATFAAFGELVTRLAKHGPTVLVLEDLHWADATSLRLTEQLAHVAESHPLLLVLTRRPEPDKGVSALEEKLASMEGVRVRRLELSCLSDPGSAVMVRALAGDHVDEAAIAAVIRGTGGNPLFMEERFFSLLEVQALVRGSTGWQLEKEGPGDLPELLGRLVQARLDRLGPAARRIVSAASVLGAEFSLPMVRAVVGPGAELEEPLAELRSAGLLVELRDQPGPSYRFRHALIQEAAYQALLKDQRQRLHARAAWGLEKLAAGKTEEASGVLARHFSLGGEQRRAAHYFALAGDHALAAYANEEAVELYRSALELSEDTLIRAELGLKLSRALSQTGDIDMAQKVGHIAAVSCRSQEPLLAARCYSWLGSLEADHHRYSDAADDLARAEEVLAELPDKGTDQWVEAWLEVQLALLSLYYWQNETDLAVAVQSRAHPLVEARGSLRQKARFYLNRATHALRRSRYLVDDGIIADFRKAWATVCEAGADELYWVEFEIGFAQLFRGDLDEAEHVLEKVLSVARRARDDVTVLRCLSYLACTHLRQHDPEGVRRVAPEGEALARKLVFPEYLGMAKAALSWAAWAEGDFDQAGQLAGAALTAWDNAALWSYPFWWVALFPLVSVRLAQGRTAEAADAAGKMIGPPRQRLPDELEAALVAGISAFRGGNVEMAGSELAKAVEVARRLRYA